MQNHGLTMSFKTYLTNHILSLCDNARQLREQSVWGDLVMPLIHPHPPFPVTASGRRSAQLLQGTAESCGMEGCWQVKRSSFKPLVTL